MDVLRHLTERDNLLKIWSARTLQILHRLYLNLCQLPNDETLEGLGI